MAGVALTEEAVETHTPDILAIEVEFKTAPDRIGECSTKAPTSLDTDPMSIMAQM